MVVSWVMSILSVALLSVISGLVLSGKRMGKFVSAVFASLTILIIVAPLPNLLKNGASTNLFFTPDTQLDSDYLGFANDLKANSLARAVNSQLIKAGYHGVEIEIKGEFNDEIKISEIIINLSNLVMDENVVHINKYDALTRIVSDCLKVDKGIIVFYE